jgi:hypothetical protein
LTLLFPSFIYKHKVENFSGFRFQKVILRINHAEVVKQAKEAGVSTEGSTLDILERIQRKMLEELYE